MFLCPMPADRPQAPGYLANLMARLFHEVAGQGLAPLGIRPEQFPILVELWFGDGPVTRRSLSGTQEASPTIVDALVRTLADDGLIAVFPASADENLVPTAKALAARDGAIPAARRANAAAAGALSEAEMTQFLGMMNRVIDALQQARD